MSGSDALSFLQGQFTNELRGLAPGAAVYGLWLTVKGKVLADSFVVRAGLKGQTSAAVGEAGADVYWVGSYHSPAAVIRERLEAFVIADDVVIEDATPDWEGVTVWGGETERRAAEQGRVGFVFPSRRSAPSVSGANANASPPASASAAWDWVFPAAQRDAAAASALAALPVLTATDAEQRRIATGTPAVPADIGAADLPNEAGLEATAISFTKGCYLGQEVMARLKSMGQVRRRLLRVRGTSAAPAALPAALFAGDKKLGELRSVAPDPAGSGFIGLAMLSLLNLTPGAALSLAPGAVADIHLVDSPSAP